MSEITAAPRAMISTIATVAKTKRTTNIRSTSSLTTLYPNQSVSASSSVDDPAGRTVGRRGRAPHVPALNARWGVELVT
jgi:hypothetical protein